MKRDEISKLSREDKYTIWFDYFLTQLGLIHNFHVRDVHPTKLTENNTKGWGEPDKTFGNLEFRYLWKNLRYKDFSDFTDEDLYEWYWRFEDRIVFKQRDFQNQ